MSGPEPDHAGDPDAIRAAWADRDGEYSPTYYAYRGADATSEAVRTRLETLVGVDASVLEVGCSAGRHLAHLHDHGFRALHGVDINPDAVAVLRAEYPDLAADATVHTAELGAFLRDCEPDAYDAVYAVETLQHVHPDDAWVFDEIARVARRAVVTAEIEAPGGGGSDPDGNDDPDGDADTGSDPAVTHVDADLPLYYRDWGRVFEAAGCREAAPPESLRRDTVRAFHAPAGDA